MEGIEFDDEFDYRDGDYYESGVKETNDQPTARQLRRAVIKEHTCLCGTTVKNVTTYISPSYQLIMGKYNSVIYHDYAVNKLASHYENYWKKSHPDAYRWWRRGANRPLNYHGQLLIRGKPPTE